MGAENIDDMFNNIYICSNNCSMQFSVNLLTVYVLFVYIILCLLCCVLLKVVYHVDNAYYVVYNYKSED